MATISERERKGYVTYQAKVRKRGISRSETFDRRSEAMRWAEDMEYAIINDLPLPGEDSPTGDSYLCKDAIEKYLRVVSPLKKGRTAEKQDGWDAEPLLAYFGKRNLQEIRRKDVEIYMEARLQGTGIFVKTKSSKRKGVGVGNSPIRHELSLLSDVYNNARLRWGYDNLINPVNDIKRPAPPEQRKRILTEKEAEGLLNAAKQSAQPMLYPFILLTLHGAMRPSEAAGLQWDEVGWEQHTLYIPESRVKTSSQRRVPLTNDAYGLLESLQKKADPKNPNVFLPAEKNIQKTLRPSAYFNRSFKTALKNAKIDNFTAYGLRHTGGTYMLKNGIDVGTVSKIMGHSGIDQTMKYLHLVDEDKVEAVKVLNGLGMKKK